MINRLIPTTLLFLLAVIGVTSTSADTAKYSHLEPLSIFQDCADCPEMVVLPTGRFEMGAPVEESLDIFYLWNKPKPGEPVGYLHEGPVHWVEIDIPIAMGRNEVTRGEWMACVAEGGCTHDPSAEILTLGGNLYADDPRHPVIDVSYLDMLEYVSWLNAKTGTGGYRLPTEAEWEYAAQAGTDTKFGQGDTLSFDQANIGKFIRDGNRSFADPENRKMPVLVDDLDAANPWGLRHMAGNVRERTMSCWSERHLGLATTSEYLAHATQARSCERVPKGGAYGGSEEYARPANRGRSPEDYRSETNGFRVLKQLNEE